jgi:hypothetical protein
MCSEHEVIARRTVLVIIDALIAGGQPVLGVRTTNLRAHRLHAHLLTHLTTLQSTSETHATHEISEFICIIVKVFLILRSLRLNCLLVLPVVLRHERRMVTGCIIVVSILWGLSLVSIAYLDEAEVTGPAR